LEIARDWDLCERPNTDGVHVLIQPGVCCEAALIRCL